MKGASPCDKTLLRDGDEISITKAGRKLYVGPYTEKEHNTPEIMNNARVLIYPLGKAITDIANRKRALINEEITKPIPSMGTDPRKMDKTIAGSENDVIVPKFWELLYAYDTIEYDLDRDRLMDKMRRMYADLLSLSSSPTTEMALQEVSRLMPDKLLKAERALAALAGVDETPSYDELIGLKDKGLFENAWLGLNEDLNTQRAIGAVFGALRRAQNEQDPLTQWKGLHFMLHALGIELPIIEEIVAEDAPAEIQLLAEQRIQARSDKNWALSDELRDAIKNQGWIVKDGADGYTLERI